MTRAPRRIGAGGFTLLELLIALSIVGALLAIAFGGLRVAIAAWGRADERVEYHQHTRAITQIVSRAVGAAYPYRGAPGEAPEKRILFNGTETRLELVTRAAPFPSTVNPAFTAVVIGVEDDEKQGRGLVIRQRILPNREPFTQATVMLRDPSVSAVELRYLNTDGTWKETWDGEAEQGLPAAIRIRLGTPRAGAAETPPLVTITLRVLTPP